jgi:AraC family transcriptional regulator of arabinose operon
MDIPPKNMSYPLVRGLPRKTFFPEPIFPGASFETQGIGYREPMTAGIIDRLHGTDDYLFMYFHSPARIGFSESAPLCAGGHLMIWPPGLRHVYGHPRRRYLHSWMHAAGPALEPLLRQNRIPLGAPFPLLSSRAFLEFLGALHRELASPAADAIIAANLLENWLRDLGRTLRRPGRQTPPALRRVRDHIDAAYAEPLTIGRLARLARLSPAYFSTEFRRCFGSAPLEYTIRRRLHHAAYLLHDVNLSIAEVGRAVGYEDLFHFSKIFKKTHRISPRKYRARLAVRHSRK